MKATKLLFITLYKVVTDSMPLYQSSHEVILALTIEVNTIRPIHIHVSKGSHDVTFFEWQLLVRWSSSGPRMERIVVI